MGNICTARQSGKRLQRPGPVLAANRACRSQTHLRQRKLLIHARIPAAVPRRDHSNVVQHCQLDAVLSTVKVAASLRFCKGSANVAKQACNGRDIQQNQPRSPAASLGKKAGVVAVHHPAVGSDRAVVQGAELVRGAGNPVDSRLVEELIQVNTRQIARAGDGICQRRLAAVRWSKNADAFTEISKLLLGSICAAISHLSGPQAPACAVPSPETCTECGG